MWLTSLLSNWKLIGIGSLICALGASMLYGRVLKAELNEKITLIEYMTREAASYHRRSEATAKEINDGIPKLLEQAKATALANYRAKYPRNAACGIRADSLPVMSPGAGETISTEVANGVPEPEFVAACASDVLIVSQWRQWAVSNQLPVE